RRLRRVAPGATHGTRARANRRADRLPALPRAGRGGGVPVQGDHRDPAPVRPRSEEHTSELQSRFELVCRLLLENKKISRLLKFSRVLVTALCPPADSPL